MGLTTRAISNIKIFRDRRKRKLILSCAAIIISCALLTLYCNVSLIGYVSEENSSFRAELRAVTNNNTNYGSTEDNTGKSIGKDEPFKEDTGNNFDFSAKPVIKDIVENSRNHDAKDTEGFKLSTESNVPKGGENRKPLLDYSSSVPKSNASGLPPLTKALVPLDSSKVTKGMGMCILVKDDLNKLSEWLAYHYHNMPLRYLVVALDPDSVTTPFSILDKWKRLTSLEYEIWHDNDYLAKEILIARMQRKFNALRPGWSLEDRTRELLYLHRERQLKFMIECSLHLKRKDFKWVAQVDTDEFITFNSLIPEEPLPLENTTAYTLRKNLPSTGEISIMDYLEENSDKEPLKNTSSCIGMTRMLFGGDDRADVTKLSNIGNFDTRTFDTLSFFKRAPVGHEINAYQKLLLDVSQIPEAAFNMTEAFSIHRLWSDKCPSGLAGNETFAKSILRVQHYLGSWEAYSARKDTRRSYEVFKRKASFLTNGPTYNMQDWLQHFIADIGLETSYELLSDRLPINNPVINHDEIITKDSDDPHCALLFFGLPRQFKSIVYPTIKKYVIDPNQNCKIFVHAYNVTQANEARSGTSTGHVNIEELKLLTLSFDESQVLLETEEQFLNQRNLTFFRQFHPRPSAWSYPSSIDNMIRQWHSIEGAWKTMEHFENKNEMHFDRVGLFRLDLKYEEAVDVESSEEVAVVPQFMYKGTTWSGTNDRLFYGLRNAAEIWATNRFASVEEYLTWHESNPDYENLYGLHSEDFVRYLMYYKWGVPVEDKLICIKRVRSDGNILEKDCDFMLEQFHLKENLKQEVEILNNTIPGVVVLGMHRSGTSMLTGILVETSSYKNPGQRVVAGGIDKGQNKKGFYEPWHVVRQNDIWLKNNGMLWNKINQHELRINADQRKFSPICGLKGCSPINDWEHVPIVLADYNNKHNTPWVLKDPRLCITLKQWLPLLDGAPPAILFTFRHPMNVASSLLSRHTETVGDFDEALYLWLQYNFHAIQNSQDMCRVVTSDEAIIADPELELDNILKGLEGCGLPSNDFNQTALTSFIDASEQHSKIPESNCLMNDDDGNNLDSIDIDTSNKNKKKLVVHSSAMKLYCDMKSRKAFEPDYDFPTIPPPLRRFSKL